jgi:tetratricopeptide (TPR) repeat protein
VPLFTSPRVCEPAGPVPPLPGVAAAREWRSRAGCGLRDLCHASSEAECLVRLGEVHLVLGRYEHAAGNLHQALAVFREIGDRVLEADALNGLGEVLLRTGQAAQARARHAAALRLASEVGLPREQARAHNGLACACQAGGDPAQARRHWQEALTRYAAIGAPEAGEIRARLAPAGDSQVSRAQGPASGGSTTTPSPR